MPSSWLLCCMALVRTDVSEERSASIIRVTHSIRNVSRLLVTIKVIRSSPIPVTLMMEAPRSSETSVLRVATQRT
jgi:hypothetical protein